MKYLFPTLHLTILMLIIGCGGEPSEDPQTETTIDLGTEKMVTELKAIAEDKSNINIWHLNKLRAQAIDQQMANVSDPGQRIQMLFRSGTEWLNAGDYTTAIERLKSIVDFVDQNNLQLPPDADYGVRELLGMAFMRKGEIENCIGHHNEYSCLLPIAKEGQHVEREGAENALEIFKALLDHPNASLQTKWLYNVAQMTLGGYPDQIAKKDLIDPKVFKSEAAFPRFKEIASSIGLGVNDISGSVVFEDFNNDHYLDLMVSSYGLDDQLRYFQNDTKGGFTDLTESASLTGLLSGLNMVQADYNNDGHVDVLVLRGAWLGKDGKHPNSLLQNNGDGTFSDVTHSSGLYTRFPTQTASWADYNNDGWVDLFIANEHTANSPAPCQLFENQGDGTFKDIATTKGINVQAFIKGCVWNDIDNDGDQDIYLSCINGPNYLMVNQGQENGFSFKNMADEAGVSGPQKSFPCWFFDYDQDGWDDLFVSGFDFAQFTTAAGEVAMDYLQQPTSAELPILYKNNGNGTFSNVTKKAKVDKVLFTMGCNFGDLNNDGYPDFYAATGTPDFRALIPNRMFLNQSGNQFADVTTAGGFGHLQKGHGVAFGDIDNDGDQDVYCVLGGSYDGDNFMNALFQNPGVDGHWVKLKLIGTTANKAAIGARIKITASDKNGNQHTFYNRVNSGGSFGANTLMVEQGLGDYKQIDQVDIIWPGETLSQTVEGISSGSTYIVTQGQTEAKSIDTKAVELKEGHHHHHH